MVWRPDPNDREGPSSLAEIEKRAHHPLQLDDALLHRAGLHALLELLEQGVPVVQLAGLRITGPYTAQHPEDRPVTYKRLADFLPALSTAIPTPKKTRGAAIIGTKFAPVASITTTDINMTTVKTRITSPMISTSFAVPLSIYRPILPRCVAAG